VTPDPVRRAAARTATFVAIPLALVVLLLSAFVFGGFGSDPPATGPVTMTQRELAPDVAGLCQAVIADLPETAAGHARRPVTAGAEQNAAYGDPPITLECGTPQPEVGATDFLFTMVANGEDDQRYEVCWHRSDGEDRTLWTTVNRAVPVTVTVPGPPDGSFLSVSPFSASVGANLPMREADQVPTGCTENPPTVIATPS
jgi:hypothetical protein